jgi:hypothetical protein
MNYKDMDYKEIAEERETCHSVIKTSISNTKTISSVYRKYSNAYFVKWGWETFLWDGPRIEKEFDVLYNADDVMTLHARVYMEEAK